MEDSAAALLPGSFLTCSSDNTIRLWSSDIQQSHYQSSKLYSQVSTLCSYVKFRKIVYNYKIIYAVYTHRLCVHLLKDLVKIVYVGNDTGHLKSLPDKAEVNQDGKFGIRVLGISPDGQHLAAGDRSGNLRWDMYTSY